MERLSYKTGPILGIRLNDSLLSFKQHASKKSMILFIDRSLCDKRKK